MPLPVEAADPKSRSNVALLRGAMALFAVSKIPDRITCKQLLATTAVSSSSDDWYGCVLTMRAFAASISEQHRLYERVGS